MRASCNKFVMWGASGHAKVLRECLTAEYELVALFDNNPAVMNPFVGVPLYVGLSGFSQWLAQGDTPGMSFLVAIGGDKGRDRLDLHALFEREGLIPLTAVHSTAFVAASAHIGAGCHILAGARVCVDAQLGRQTIVNTQASVDHECNIGQGVHIAPGATITGCVSVGGGTMIGAGAVVLPHVTIGVNAVIGAGAVVTRDIPDNVIAYGNPARIMGTREN